MLEVALAIAFKPEKFSGFFIDFLRLQSYIICVRGDKSMEQKEVEKAEDREMSLRMAEEMMKEFFDGIS